MFLVEDQEVVGLSDFFPTQIKYLFDRLIVSGNIFGNDFWVFNVSSLAWRWISGFPLVSSVASVFEITSSDASIPQSLLNPAYAYDALRRLFYVHGGSAISMSKTFSKSCQNVCLEFDSNLLACFKVWLMICGHSMSHHLNGNGFRADKL